LNSDEELRKEKKMNRMTIILFAALSVGIVSCSKKQSKTAGVSSENPAKDPGVSLAVVRSDAALNNLDNENYLEQVGEITYKQNEKLSLSSDQEKILQRINQQRAEKLKEALAKKNINNELWMQEIKVVNKWTSSEYQKLFSPKQYDEFLEAIGEYSEFNFFYEDFKIKGEGDDLKIKYDNTSKYKKKSNESKIKLPDEKIKTDKKGAKLERTGVKVKVEEGESKIKSGDVKIKESANESKTKMPDAKVKSETNETKTKTPEQTIKQEKGKYKEETKEYELKVKE
jgi:hypothetical protein